MHEKELRLAIVCFGGVSLAVYMHGVTKEILKLARASAAYHRHPDLAARASLRYHDLAMNGGDDIDTEAVYFDVLKAMGDQLDLRVIIDAVAGASAGGINGVFLSRALAHDLAYDPLRDLWLREADVTRLASKEEPEGFWSRTFIAPTIRFVTRRIVGARGLGQPVSDKIPPLLRLRRLKPPFDGLHLVRLIYDGLMTMGDPKGAERSLMPPGHRLETFVTVTDFYGFLRYLPLHNPPLIAEREHRHSFEFSFIRWQNGEYESDFGTDDVPGLAFAARATSSFPGAYPPATLAEIDSVLDERGLVWKTKDRFFVQNFSGYLRAGLDPHNTAFLDGSVLNNKPFGQVIHSIQGRPAFREVERRIVYIDPHPDELMAQPSGPVPNLWHTLKAALSDIPRNEPIHDDLAEIQALNKEIRLIRSVIDAIRPRVSQLVGDIITCGIDRATSENVRGWRVEANARAAKDAGYSYEGYSRLKINATLRYLGGIAADICGFAWESAEHQKLVEVLSAWVFRDPIEGHRMALPDFAFETPETLPNWIRFLIGFDLGYQRRRIRFVIGELNTLYATPPLSGSDDNTVKKLDALKVKFYDLLARMRQADSGAFVTAELRSRFHFAFRALEADNGPLDPAVYYAAHRTEIDLALAGLAEEMALEQIKSEIDAIYAELHNDDLPDETRRELLYAYLGFGFWDVITFSILGSREYGELNEIKIDRISPNDAKTLNGENASPLLKGVAMRHFGAFFSRKDRENDYLWGRLNAAERLIDILLDEARSEGASRALRGLEAKKAAFKAILDTEEQYVPASATLVANLRKKLAEL